MPKAFSILPNRFQDLRHEKIEKGLERVGFKIVRQGLPDDERDVLITWTRHQGHKHRLASDFEAKGGQVIVCEEGYFRKIGGKKYFSLALHDHNGAGKWTVGGPYRWESFGIPLDPWRMTGNYILVCEQRGIGSPSMGSPEGWHTKTMRWAQEVFDVPVVLRAHPKTRKLHEIAQRQPTIEEQLRNALGVIIWNTAFGVHALRAGVPVIYGAPYFICENACSREGWFYSDQDRLEAFERMAWAQWSEDEIESGQAFDYLLRVRPY